MMPLACLALESWEIVEAADIGVPRRVRAMICGGVVMRVGFWLVGMKMGVKRRAEHVHEHELLSEPCGVGRDSRSSTIVGTFRRA